MVKNLLHSYFKVYKTTYISYLIDYNINSRINWIIKIKKNFVSCKKFKFFNVLTALNK
jgi:hypothetical protein